MTMISLHESARLFVFKLNMIIKQTPEKFFAVQNFINELNKSNSPLKEVMKNTDCYIAGGFARLLLRNSLISYSSISESNNYNLALTKYFNVYNGDIDVFFTSHDEWFKAVQIMLKHEQHSIKETVFARSYEIKNDFFTVPLMMNMGAVDRVVKIKVQFIKLFEEKIENTLSRFDLCNAMIGFNNEHILMHENLSELESTQTLEISNITSVEFLESNDYHLQVILNRLLKYSQKYDYKTISESSIEKLKDFLMKRKVMFGTEFQMTRFLNDFLKNRNIFSKDVLINFIGLVGETIHSSYVLEKDGEGFWRLKTTTGSYGALFDRALQEMENIEGEKKKQELVVRNYNITKQGLEKHQIGSKGWVDAKSSYLDWADKYEKITS